MLRSARAWLLSPSLTARESIARAPSATRDATTSDDDDAFEDVEDEFAPALRSTQETLVERDARARAAIEVIDLLDDETTTTTTTATATATTARRRGRRTSRRNARNDA